MKISKILAIFFVITMMISVMNISYATGGNFDLSGFEDGQVTGSISNLTQNTAGAVISIVRTAGIGIAITILLVIGMKYMTASAGDRADIKKHAVPFVIGAVVLFGASGILGIILKFANTISG